ncbi:MAG: flagellar motor protein MotB [Parvularculaceae bacterium]
MAPRAATLASRRTRPAGGFRPAGGWLVTYADLMPILVCFFVLIVSFSVQDEVKLEVLAGSMRDAFGVAERRRFAGDVRYEGVPERRQPADAVPRVEPSGAGLSTTLSGDPAIGEDGANAAVDAGPTPDARNPRAPYVAAKARLERAVLSNPLLKDASEAITVNLVEDGLQIVLVDVAGRPMFEPGAREPTPFARDLLETTAAALAPLANRILIEAHADARGAGAYSPFDLTADRANAARRAMAAAGLPADRIAAVVGRGDAEPLYPEDPFAPGNRRVEIVLERAAPLLPPDRSL